VALEVAEELNSSTKMSKATEAEDRKTRIIEKYSGSP
jgi:hypothetical protein